MWILNADKAREKAQLNRELIEKRKFAARQRFFKTSKRRLLRQIKEAIKEGKNEIRFRFDYSSLECGHIKEEELFGALFAELSGAGYTRSSLHGDALDGYNFDVWWYDKEKEVE